MYPYRVVVTDLTESGNDIELEVFAQSGLPISLVSAEETGRAGLLAATAGAHALMVRFATIDQALIRTLTSCLVIARYGVGAVDMVDIDVMQLTWAFLWLMFRTTALMRSARRPSGSCST